MSREVERNTQRLACTLYIRLVDLFVDALDGRSSSFIGGLQAL